jgi:hypothetical protein
MVGATGEGFCSLTTLLFRRCHVPCPSIFKPGKFGPVGNKKLHFRLFGYALCVRLEVTYLLQDVLDPFLTSFRIGQG